MLDSLLISVHVPKTGGTTFKEVLKFHYGQGVLFDYDDRPMNQGSFLRNLSALTNMIKIRDSYNNYQCIHGHFLPIKYAFLRNKSLAIWFRDPVERILSRYYHHQRSTLSNEAHFKKHIKTKDITLEEFIKIKHYQNLYHKYLFGMKLENFDFIGITEQYNSSLDIFRAIYGIKPINHLEPKNTNPKKNSKRYIIDDEVKKLILHHNRKDYDIYLRALEINNSMKKKYL